MTDILTKSLTRDKIQKWVGTGNHELVKFVEDLSQDVRVTLPAAIVAATAGDAQTVISSAAFLPRINPQVPDLADAQAVAAMAAFLPRQGAVPQDPAEAQSVTAIAAFLPHQGAAAINPADAQFVLAGQIFGA